MIVVTMHLKCGGCFTTAEATTEVRISYESIFGGAISAREYRPDRIRDLNAPEGWWIDDPWTTVSYCPKCKKEIERKHDSARN